LAIASGDGTLKPLVVSKEAGLHLVSYSPGAKSGYVHFVALAGQLKAEAVLYQNGPDEAPRLGATLGTASQEHRVLALRERISVLELTRPDVAATATNSVPASISGAPVASIPMNPSSPRHQTTGQPKKSKVSAGETAMLRLRYGLGFSPLQYSANTKEGALAFFPPTAKFAVTPIALAVQAEAWFGPGLSFGAEASVQMGFYALELGDDTSRHAIVPVKISAGGRYRFPMGQGPWSVWVGLGGVKDSSLLVKYSDDTRTSGEPVSRTFSGVRATGAIRGEWADWLVEARVNSTFTPIPDFNPSVRVEWRARDTVTAGVSLSFDVRYLMLKFDSPDARVAVTELNETVLFYSGLVF
jgi:hypothetical protein